MIGFDMDHTLAPYKRDTFEALAFRLTVEKFIEAGYPEELRELKFEPNFIIRGLLVDKERGNLLKVDSHKYVKVAYHGHQKMAKEDRHKLYNKQSYKAEYFGSVDTFFALSEVQLFVEIVDYMNRNPGRIKKSFREVYNDLREFIDLCHRDGSIKSEVIKDPEKYINRDKYLANSLVRLIDADKKLFLLTNSLFDYTNHIMNFLLDGAHEDFSDWKDYFHIIIVGAAKPGFFMGSQPFYEVVLDSNLLKIHDGILRAGAVYHGGNAKLFEKLTDHIGDEILYVGDHIYGDIIRSKGTLNWRTLLVIEELEDEIPKLESTKFMLESIYKKIAEKEALDEVIQKTRSKIATLTRQMQKNKNKARSHLLDIEIAKHQEALVNKWEELNQIEYEIRKLIEEREQKFHPIWGEIMKVGLERSRFANQVGSYACLYTSKVSNLRFYSPLKKFVSFHETLPHDI